jgi:hypothetical protein
MLITLAVETIIAGGALIQAVLGAYLLINYASGSPALAWAAPLATAAKVLLFPFARLLNQAPSQVEGLTVMYAMALYLAATVAAVGVINLLLRQPRVRPPYFGSPGPGA